MRGTQHDVFPAQVSILPASDTETELRAIQPLRTPKNGYHITDARVTIANGRILIARDDPSTTTGPLIVFSDFLADDPDAFSRSETRDGISYLTTRSGQKVAYVRDSACGCGSRLRSWNPLKFMTSTEG